MRPSVSTFPLLVCPLLFSLAVCEVRWGNSQPEDSRGAVRTTPTPTPRVASPTPTAQETNAAAPPLLSREAWQAKEPGTGMKPHEPSRITVHHTATAQKPDSSLESKMRALQSFSQQEAKLAGGKTKPAWPDVPYHFYVDARGRIAEGRNIVYAGDTNTDYDPTGHVLVVLEGNFETEHPTGEQVRELGRLLRWLCGRWHVPAADIKGHGDYAATACPGKNLKSELPRLRESVGGKGEQR